MSNRSFVVDVSDTEHLEEWRQIPRFEGYYEVSTLGRVRSVTRTFTCRDGRVKTYRGRVLKPQFRSNTGYLMVALSKDGVVEDWYIHRLVLTTFRGDPQPGEEGCHGNDIRTDNRLENLRWDTHHANVHDAISRNRMRNHNVERTHCRRGHPFDEASFDRWDSRRSCKVCKRMKERERYHASKAHLIHTEVAEAGN